MKEEFENRTEELHKHALALSRQQELIDAPQFDRPQLMLEMSRLALGLDPQCDIADLAEVQKSELLTVVRALRDNLLTQQI